MQFIGINLGQLRNSTIIQFFTDVIQIVTLNNPATLLVAPQLAALLGINTQLDLLHRTDQGSDLTPLLQATDRRRDDAIIGIRALADAYSYHFDPAKRAAGISIVDNITMYGNKIAQQSLIDETTNLRNIIQDLNTLPELMAAVALLQLDAWKAELQTANDLFSAQYIARTQEIGAMNPATILEKRLEANQSFYTLRDTIGAYHTINNGINPWGKTVNELNALIEQYNVLLASNGGGQGENPPPPPPQPQP